MVQSFPGMANEIQRITPALVIQSGITFGSNNIQLGTSLTFQDIENMKEALRNQLLVSLGRVP
jgi:hypothetical protein